MTKACTGCKTVKESTEFYVRRPVRGTRQKTTGLQSRCKACQNADRVNFRNQSRLAVRKSNLKKYYGITLDQFNEMRDRQQGKCLICDAYKGDALSVDHDHTTSAIRGLLCRTCNTGLGMFKDSPEFLAKAIKYLEEKL